MATLRFVYSAIKGEFAAAVREMQKPVARGITLALSDVVEEAKAVGRSNIASAGFSQRWQNALRGNKYPDPDKQVFALDPAATVYHKIPYAGVFETGKTIAGSPYLWIPLPNVQARYRGKRMSPAIFEATVAPLHPMRDRKTGGMFLAAYLPLGSDLAGTISVSRFRAGNRRRNSRGILSVVSVPVFRGVNQVTLSARFRIIPATQAAFANLGKYYLDHIRKGK